MAMEENNWRERVTNSVARLKTAPRHIGIPAGLGLIVGGTILAPLPVFGVWMVPLGLALLAPHSPGAAKLSKRMHWWSLRALKWAIRNNFVRVKQRSKQDATNVDGSG